MRSASGLRNWPMTLALIATTLPIAVGYAVSVFILSYLFVSGRWRWLWQQSIVPQSSMVVTPRDFAARVTWMLRPLTLGCLALVLGHLLAAIAGTQLSPWTKPLGGSLAEWSHAAGKYGVLWCTISLGAISAAVDGWNLKRAAQVMFGWMAFLLLYSTIQHWTGIDLVHGLGAKLGANRYAYGVYRVSGLMGHPLTFAYNLMLVTLFSLAMALKGDVDGVDRGRNWWLGCVALGSAMLLISGSRFVLLVLLATLTICEWRRIWAHKFKIGLGLLVVAALLWLDGTILARFGELFDKSQSLNERFPRLLFWQLHWRMFLENPVAGVTRSGLHAAMRAYFSDIGQHDTIYEAHNLFLQYLADTGVIGFIGLLAWMTGLWMTWRRLPSGSARGASYIIVATFISALMQNNLRDSAFVFALWYVLSILIVDSIAKPDPLLEIQSDDRKSTENFVARAHPADPATGM